MGQLFSGDTKFSGVSGERLSGTGNTLTIDPETGRRVHDSDRVPGTFGAATGAGLAFGRPMRRTFDEISIGAASG